MLRFAPISLSMLPHTITVFCRLTHEKDLYLPVVIRHVNFQQSTAYNYMVSGQSTSHAFSVVVDYVNSVADGGRRFVTNVQWKTASKEEQENELYTLHQDIWLVQGEHPSLAAKIPSRELTQSHFDSLGLFLLKARSCDIAGLDPVHNIQLRG